MSKYVIDILKEEYKDFPITMDGQVFIEKTVDAKGNHSGYLTTSVENILKIKAMSDEDIEKIGWTDRKHILDSFE